MLYTITMSLLSLKAEPVEQHNSSGNPQIPPCHYHQLRRMLLDSGYNKAVRHFQGQDAIDSWYSGETGAHPRIFWMLATFLGLKGHLISQRKPIKWHSEAHTKKSSIHCRNPFSPFLYSGNPAATE